MKKIFINSLSALVFSWPIAVVSCSSKNSTKYIKNNSNFFSKSFVEKFENNFEKIIDNNFYLINGINLTDENIGGDDAQIDFKTREIFVSSNNIKNKNWNDDIKAEYIYQLVFHEYNHFLNYLFLNNLDNSDPEIDKTIYRDIGSARNPERWNKHFLKEFKRILKYDKNTPLYKPNKIKNKYVSIGSVYNQKDLFDIANAPAKPSFNRLKGIEVMAPLTYDKYLPIDDNHIIKGNSLSYLYSLQELVARKMQIINMQYHPFESKGQGFDDNGWIYDQNGNHTLSPYLQDIVNYKGGKNSKDLYLLDEPTEDLGKLYSSYVDNLSNIRQITFKNNYKRVNNKIIGNIDKSKISFSGTFTKKAQVGYLENKSFKAIPATWLFYKKHYEYHTDYFNQKDIINKPLVFKIGNEINLMSSVRQGNFGRVTTYDFNNSIDHNLIVEKDKNSIKIKKLI